MPARRTSERTESRRASRTPFPLRIEGLKSLATFPTRSSRNSPNGAAPCQPGPEGAQATVGPGTAEKQDGGLKGRDNRCLGPSGLPLGDDPISRGDARKLAVPRAGMSRPFGPSRHHGWDGFPFRAGPAWLGEGFTIPVPIETRMVGPIRGQRSSFAVPAATGSRLAGRLQRSRTPFPLRIEGLKSLATFPTRSSRNSPNGAAPCQPGPEGAPATVGPGTAEETGWRPERPGQPLSRPFRPPPRGRPDFPGRRSQARCAPGWHVSALRAFSAPRMGCSQSSAAFASG